MKASLIFSAVLLAATAQAQAPGAAGGPPPKVPGVSDAGNAILAKSMNARTQQLVPLVQQVNALGTQLNAVLNAPTLDVSRFAALLQQRRSISGQIAAKQDEWLIGVLNQMTPADRLPLVRALVAGGRPAGSGAPPR